MESITKSLHYYENQAAIKKLRHFKFTKTFLEFAIAQFLCQTAIPIKAWTFVYGQQS